MEVEDVPQKSGQRSLSEKFAGFVRSIKPSDRIAILFHPDPDGICAAAICNRALYRLGKRVALVYHQPASEVAIKKKTVELLRKKKINRVITADIAVDQDPETVRDIEKFARVAVIDHHVINNDLSSKRTLFLKASLVNPEIPPDQHCTSKLAYDLFSSVVNIEEMDWVAAVGIIADKNDQTWKAFLREVADKYNVNVKRLFEVEDVINSAKSGGAKTSKICRVIFSAREMRQVLDSELRHYVDAVRREIRYWVHNRKRFAEIYPEIKLVWYEVNPKLGIKARLANELSSEYWPNWTVLIVTKNAKADISARRQDRAVSMHELMKAAAQNISGASGGGHVPAAGGLVPIKSLEQFKQNVIEFLKAKAPAKQA